jgi:HAD superfamily hydrolase (TIGR01549 family)
MFSGFLRRAGPRIVGDNLTRPMVEAVIFDLDDTLLDTSVVSVARASGQWAIVKARLDRVEPFSFDGIAIEEIPARLKATGLKIGVLTHSPGWYATALLDRLEIRADAIVTGSDGYAPKPDPTSLKALADELGVAIGECVYVGDLDIDVAAAAAAGAISVGVTWSKVAPASWRRWWPDVAISKPERLLEFEELDRLRPLAEAVLAGVEPRWHWGTLMRLEQGLNGLGRYLTPEDIERFPDHALSHLVLDAKNDAAKAEQVAEIFARLAGRPSWRAKGPDLVVSVPPAPGADLDRFAPVRSALAAALDARDGSGVLTMNFPVDDYKRQAHEVRRALNAGRFSAAAIDGGRVLLIDDVLTSGGQVEACREALLDAGAETVAVVALAATQDRLPEGCPLCGGRLRIYHRGRDGRPFVGCPNYFTPLRCPYTRDA